MINFKKEISESIKKKACLIKKHLFHNDSKRCSHFLVNDISLSCQISASLLIVFSENSWRKIELIDKDENDSKFDLISSMEESKRKMFLTHYLIWD
jgi:hypothetical protein